MQTFPFDSGVLQRGYGRPRKPLVATRGTLCTLLLLCLSVLVSSGCTTLDSSSPADHEGSPSEPGGDRVFALFINSPLDVPQFGRLAQAAAYFRDQGFPDSSFIMRTSGAELAAWTRDIRRGTPNARIALIGWSGASLWIWDALTELNTSGESVDLIVYLDSNWIKTRVSSQGHPTNYGRALLIYRRDNPPVTGVPNAESKRVDTDFHLAVAAHPDTLRYLLVELRRLAEE